MLQKTAPLLASFVFTGLLAFSATPSQAVSLPVIKASGENTVPACVTPGRLMAYLKDNNGKLRKKFDNIATYYMRHGERLELRWDYAFFQMLVETGFLRYNGDVKWHQNNFAGLGATGGGVRGESFKTVETGVKAHLEHLLMYSGTYVENPTAERTRKIQEWKVLAKWQRKFKKRAMTYKDMAARWAPGSHGYPRDMEFVGERFYQRFCNTPDPRPELVAAARKGNKATIVRAATGGKKPAQVVKTTKTTPTKVAKAAPSKDTRYNLGAGTRKKAATAPELPKPKTKSNEIKTASIAGAANQAATTAKASQRGAQKATCRVWSASYGGTKAVIIKAVDKQIVNYTVLKVNDGRIQPEAKAYIHAYAKGGELVDKFPNPDQALERAFQLCPEG